MKKFSLVGVDGNAYSVMGYTTEAMKRTGFTKDEIDKTMKDAMSSDYNHLLSVCFEAVEKANEKAGFDSDDDDEEEDDEFYE